MVRDSAELELKAFYNQWKGRIFLFCRLCVGEGEAAESALRRAFFAHFCEGSSLSVDRLPLDLLRHAVDAVKEPARPCECTGVSPVSLPEEVLRLPWPHRVTFILRYVFGLPLREVGYVARLSPQEVAAMSFGALLRIRELMMNKTSMQEHDV